MLRVLAIAVCLIATPVAAQQGVVCVPDTSSADEVSRNAGEELAWIGQTHAEIMMRFYLGQKTWSVFFLRSDGMWCTAPSMIGKIQQSSAA